MQIAVISGIHAHLPALGAVPEHLARRGLADANYRRGDIVGPQTDAPPAAAWRSSGMVRASDAPAPQRMCPDDLT